MRHGYNDLYCSKACADFEPTSDEIRAAAAVIRSTWSVEEELKRRRRIPGELQVGLGE